MSNFLHRSRSVLGWFWKHTAAGIAVVVVLAALIIGYQIGRPAPEPLSEIADSGHDHGGAESGEPQMYTCSMHPAVRLPDPEAKCPICFMELIPVTDDGGEGSELRVTMSDAAAAMSRIETAPVGRFFPTAEIRLYGKVTYDETGSRRTSRDGSNDCS